MDNNFTSQRTQRFNSNRLGMSHLRVNQTQQTDESVHDEYNNQDFSNSTNYYHANTASKWRYTQHTKSNRYFNYSSNNQENYYYSKYNGPLMVGNGYNVSYGNGGGNNWKRAHGNRAAAFRNSYGQKNFYKGKSRKLKVSAILTVLGCLVFIGSYKFLPFLRNKEGGRF